MTLTDILTGIQNLGFAQAIAQDGVLFPTIESIHVLAIVLVTGSVFIVDLRLLGVAAHHQSISRLSKEILPVTWIAFVVAVITGSLLFSSAAVKYVGNPAFLIKMVFLALAGVNMLTFEFITARSVSQWDDHMRTPTAVRVAGALSLLFWIGVITAGRWIGFINPAGF